MAATLDIGNLLIHLRADASQYLRTMNGVEKKMLATANVMKSVGTKMSLAITAPLALIGVSATRAFGNFNDAMTKSLAIMGNVSEGMRNEMERTALEISTNGVTSAKELARSYFFLASAGLDAQQSVASLATVERFAVAGAFDMARATDLVTDAQSALGLTVKDAQTNMINMTRVADVLTGANTLANASTEQFAMSLTSQAGPAMKAFGIQLEEGVAVLAAYADQGIKAQNSGNLFSRMLRLMTKGFRENSGAWKQLGIDIFNAQGDLRPLADTINDLSAALETMSVRQKGAALDMLGFQARSQQAILPLLGLGNRIREYNEKLLEMRGITEEIAEKQLKSFNSQMKILKNQIVAVGIQIGRILAPMVLRLNEGIQDIIVEWNKFNDATKESIIQIGLYAAAIGPALLLTSALMKAFTFMIIPLKTVIGLFVGLNAAILAPIAGALLLAAAAYALRAAWLQNVTVIKDLMEDFANSIGEAFDHIRNTALGEFLEGFTLAWISTFKFIGNDFDEFINNIAGTFAGTKSWIKAVKDGIVDAWDAPTFHQMINELKKGFEKGADSFGSSFITASEESEKRVKEFLASVKVTAKTTAIELKGFGETATETLKELMSAMKTQFGQDTAFIVDIIKSKIKQLQTEIDSGSVDLSLTEKLEEVKEELKAMMVALQESSEMWENFKTPIQEWGAEASNIAARTGEVFANVFQSMGDELAEFLTTGKANFSDFTRSVLKDLLAIAIRARVVMPLAQGLGLIPTSPGLPGNQAAISSAGGLSSVAAQTNAAFLHTGGRVGSNGGSRSVPAAIFAGAQRFHNGGTVGLKPNEVPIIAERGEQVVPAGQGGGGSAPNVVINNQSGQELQQDGMPEFLNGEWVVNLVAEDINQGGPLRGIIKGLNR